MTCKHCCGAEHLFDLKGAKKELKRFRKKGATSATKKLIQLTVHKDRTGKSFLDIGGGIGALAWDHIQHGGKEVVGVDASSGYQEVANNYALENGWESHYHSIFGDYLDVHDQIKAHDFVSMDKVICCYPDYKQLIEAACKNCKETLAVTFPMDGWIAEFFQWMGVMYMKYIKQSDFRPYIHPVSAIHDEIKKNGFELESKAIQFPWHVRVYSRV